ncbi:MAG: hypothetical protein VX589_19170 [Myxococcota bacterium]|nr:hypothetical protein [Myxococcota bacterium]
MRAKTPVALVFRTVAEHGQAPGHPPMCTLVLAVTGARRVHASSSVIARLSIADDLRGAVAQSCRSAGNGPSKVI